jgi:hypothetical protein
MCLIKLEKTARVATTPIKVYKILTRDNCSPFQNQEYHVGKNMPYGHDTCSSAGPTITRGYLHAYLTESQASGNILVLCKTMSDACTGFKVVEMYIPAGTEYWLGENLEVAAECLYWPEDENDNNINSK